MRRAACALIERLQQAFPQPLGKLRRKRLVAEVREVEDILRALPDRHDLGGVQLDALGS